MKIIHINEARKYVAEHGGYINRGFKHGELFDVNGKHIADVRFA